MVDEIRADPSLFSVDVHVRDYENSVPVNAVILPHPQPEISGALAKTLNSPLQCEVGTLAARADHHFGQWVKVDASTPSGTVINNVAMVFSPTELELPFRCPSPKVPTVAGVEEVAASGGRHMDCVLYDSAAVA